MEWSAVNELNRGLNGSPGPNIDDFEHQIVLGTADEVRKAYPHAGTLRVSSRIHFGSESCMSAGAFGP